MNTSSVCLIASSLLAQAPVPGGLNPARPPASPLAETPETLAQRQLDAFNAHDLEAFCALHAEDVQVAELDGRILFSGMAALRDRVKTHFHKFPDINAMLVKRIILGNFVIDEERITGMRPGPIRAIAIYEIRNGRIAVVRSILEPPPLINPG